jgi:hypothetical protein
VKEAFEAALEKAKVHFFRDRGHMGLRFLTTIVGGGNGDTSLALLKHLDGDFFEAILPMDIAGETHNITAQNQVIPARIMASVGSRVIDLFNLRLSGKGKVDDSLPNVKKSYHFSCRFLQVSMKRKPREVIGLISLFVVITCINLKPERSFLRAMS